MSEAQVALGAVLGLLALTGVAGTLSANFRVSRWKANFERQSHTIDLQADSIAALEKRMDIQAVDFESCKQRLITSENTIAVLSNQVSGAEAVKKESAKVAKVLADALAVHNEQLSREHKELMGLLGKMAK